MILCYGTAAFGDRPHHLDGSRPFTPDEKYEAQRCLALLSAFGITMIDTANRYGGGQAEQLIGLYAGREIGIVTKVNFNEDVSKMEADLKSSIQRLYRKRLSGILLHNPDLSKLKKEHIDWLLDQRYFLPLVGMSTEPVREALKFYEDYPLNCIQFPFNANDSRAILSRYHEFFYRHKNVFVMANSVLKGNEISESIGFIKSHQHWIDAAVFSASTVAKLVETTRLFRNIG